MNDTKAEFFAAIDSPIGRLAAYSDGKSLKSLLPISEAGTVIGNSCPLLEKLRVELREYFDGRRENFDIPLDPGGTEFAKSVWNSLLKIPYGKTASYRDVAKSLGNKKAARAVGRAVGANNILILIPCHRVISSNGSLGGFSAGIERKKVLLNTEKIKWQA